MDRAEPDSGSLAFHLQDEDDILQLVDRWVRQFEGDANGRHHRAPTHTSSAPTGPDSDAPLAFHLDTVKSHWSRFSQAGKDGASQSEPSPIPEQTTAAQLPAATTGLLTSFTDRIGGTISLSQADGRLLHRGTVSVRRSSVSIGVVCREIGLPDQVTRAFEFVAAWFGYPFDSANVRPPDDHVLSWGFWGLAGEDLAHCLHEWNKEAPDVFTSYCGAFGIGVHAPEKDSHATSPGSRPVLHVRTGTRFVQGRGAEWVIASEPLLLAALARSGRDEIAQRTQITMAIANCVTPIMFQPWDRDAQRERLTVEALTAPRSIAPLLYLVRRHGVRAATRLMRAANQRRAAGRRDEGEDAWIPALVASLRNLNREHDAAEVLRIWSSPELTTN